MAIVKKQHPTRNIHFYFGFIGLYLCAAKCLRVFGLDLDARRIRS